MVEGPNDVLVPLGASTADSFLEQLGPQSPLWQPDPAKWIFRGQADSAWKLLAKAHRGLSAFVVAGDADGREVARIIDAPKALAGGMIGQRRLAKSLSRKQKGSRNRRAPPPS